MKNINDIDKKIVKFIVNLLKDKKAKEKSGNEEREFLESEKEKTKKEIEKLNEDLKKARNEKKEIIVRLKELNPGKIEITETEIIETYNQIYSSK